MTALEAIIDQLEKQISGLEEWLGSGQAKDYPEYQRMCGEIQGLLSAMQYTSDLKNKLESSDE
jgi:hypothetical protein